MMLQHETNMINSNGEKHTLMEILDDEEEERNQLLRKRQINRLIIQQINQKMNKCMNK